MSKRLSDGERAEALAARDELIRVRQQTYEQFKDAMTLIMGLPRPEDMAAIVRAYDRSAYAKRRIPIITRWVKDFESAWNGRDNQRSS